MSHAVLRDLRVVCQRHDAELRTLITKAVKDGARSQDIAEAMGISRATLWRRYGAALQRGANRETGKGAVRQTA